MMSGSRFLCLVILGALIAPQAQARQSMFFSADELIAIMRANQGFSTGTANEDSGDDKLKFEGEQAEQKPVVIDRGRRVLTLAGIVYQGPTEWTIWLNGERVTPRNIPENVKSLNVSRDQVQLRWRDAATRRIVNLTLRPHQQYHLDLDLITPGT